MRTEKEIKERIALIDTELARPTMKLDSMLVAILKDIRGVYEWVLSSEKKEPFPNTASCSACGEISRGTDEENKEWFDGHKENCREWKKPLKKGEYKDIVLVSSASKEKCTGMFVGGKDGLRCVCCGRKPGEESPKEVSREEKPAWPLGLRETLEPEHLNTLVKIVGELKEILRKTNHSNRDTQALMRLVDDISIVIDWSKVKE